MRLFFLLFPLLAFCQTFNFRCPVETTGFFTDPVYSTITWEDPTTYLNAFIADANRRAGLDLSYLKDYDITIRLDDLQPGICATAIICDFESIDIVIDNRCWQRSLHANVFNRKLRIMWHELGHAVFNYQHPRYSIGYNGHLDIMGYDDIFLNDWDQAADRFFLGTDHSIRNCNKAKGGFVVEDLYF